MKYVAISSVKSIRGILLFTFDIIWMNSSKSMVPSPLTSYSITRPRISSSVGFCPMDRNTGKSSLVVIVPLPSWSYDNVMKHKLKHQMLRRNKENCHRIGLPNYITLSNSSKASFSSSFWSSSKSADMVVYS